MISEIKSLFDEWIAAVARAVNFGIGRYARGRQILLSQHSDHSFVDEGEILFNRLTMFFKHLSHHG